jgi:hypothetical protein
VSLLALSSIDRAGQVGDLTLTGKRPRLVDLAWCSPPEADRALGRPQSLHPSPNIGGSRGLIRADVMMQQNAAEGLGVSPNSFYSSPKNGGPEG